jgi:hypothetical protein
MERFGGLETGKVDDRHAMAALVAPLAPPAFTTKALALRSSLPGSTVQTHATSTHYVYAGKNVLRPQAGLAVQA